MKWPVGQAGARRIARIVKQETPLRHVMKPVKNSVSIARDVCMIWIRVDQNVWVVLLNLGLVMQTAKIAMLKKLSVTLTYAVNALHVMNVGSLSQCILWNLKREEMKWKSPRQQKSLCCIDDFKIWGTQ